MEAGWGRRHAFQDLDRATIADLLRPAFPGRAVLAAEPLTGGLVNTNYKIQVAGEAAPVVLRIYTRDPTACRKDADLWRLLAGEVPLPEVLFIDPDGTGGGPVYAITRLIDGTLLNAVLAAGDSAAVGAAAYAAGRVLAAIGAHTFPQPGFFGPDLVVAEPFAAGQTAVDYIEHCLFAGRAEARLGAADTARLWRFVTDHADLLTAFAGAGALVHGDYKGGNILVRPVAGAWEVAAVLDWEFAYAGAPLFDLGIFLRYARRLPPTYEPAAIRGFQDGGGRLPPAWKRTTQLLDLMNLCDFLNTPDDRGTLIADTVALIRATIDNSQPPPAG